MSRLGAPRAKEMGEGEDTNLRIRNSELRTP
jgi:hypothetical protein